MVVRDLTTVETETGSVYVVMPVPASVQKAITVTAAAPPSRPLPNPASQSAPDQPTPRLANGKPDLTGTWTFGAMHWRSGFRRCGPTQVDCTPTINCYGRYADGGGGYGEYRVIPTDGRKHDPKKAIETTY